MYASDDSTGCVEIEGCWAVDTEPEDVSVSASYMGGSADDGIVYAT